MSATRSGTPAGAARGKGAGGTYRTTVAITEDLAALHDDLARMGVVPGWHRPGRPPMWSSPASDFVPIHRDYHDAHAALERAGALVDPLLAERRNLIVANTESGSLYATTRTQVLAYQMMLPGERARTHRHAAHAGRLVLDADGGVYTVVDGTRIFMEPGDVLLTPGGAWHGHGHDGERPAYWLDFLDVPLVQLLEPMFFEPYPGDWMEPVADDQRSPLLFPWEATLEGLADSGSEGPLGRRIELDTSCMPTITLSMHRLDPGAWTPPWRSTANHQFCVAAGEGVSRVDGNEVAWRRGDIVVVPCWHTQEHCSSEGAVLFCVSDEGLQRHCGYLREEEA